jgi:hypothetical protein
LIQGFRLADSHLQSYHIVYERAYKFLTCDGREEYLSFQAYASSYAPSPSLWAGFIITAILLHLILQAFVYVKGTQARVSVLLLVPSIFLEQPPQFPNQLLSYKSFNVFLVSLLFSALILRNSYKSIVTTDLTAPFPSTEVDTFEEAVKRGYKILPPLNAYIKAFEVSSFRTREHFLSVFLNESALTEILRYRIAQLPKNDSKSSKSMEKLKGMLKLIKAPDVFPGVSFQMEIEKCKKSIYVDHFITFPSLNFVRKSCQREIRLTHCTWGRIHFKRCCTHKALETWNGTGRNWFRSESVQSRTPGYPTILNMFIELVLWNRN